MNDNEQSNQRGTRRMTNKVFCCACNEGIDNEDLEKEHYYEIGNDICCEFCYLNARRIK